MHGYGIRVSCPTNQLPGPNQWGRATSPAVMANRLKELQKKYDMEIAAKAEGSGMFGKIQRNEDRLQAIQLKERLR
jgi:hypothetical protein